MNLDIFPRPVVTTTIATVQGNVVTLLKSSTMNIIKGDIVNLNTVGSVTRVVVILLDNEAIVSDISQRDVAEGNVADLTGLAGFSLDTDTVLGVDDLRISDLNV